MYLKQMYLKQRYLKKTNSNKLSLNQALLQSFFKRQGGNMVIMALFLIIVVGLLAGTLISIVSASSNSTIYQVYGLRAQQAAQGGVQSLLQTSFPAGAEPQSCNQTITNPSSMSNVTGLESCTFSASCETDSLTFANVDYLYFKYTSTGTCVINKSVVTRTLSVDAMQELNP